MTAVARFTSKKLGFLLQVDGIFHLDLDTLHCTDLRFSLPMSKVLASAWCSRNNTETARCCAKNSLLSKQSHPNRFIAFSLLTGVLLEVQVSFTAIVLDISQSLDTDTTNICVPSYHKEYSFTVSMLHQTYLQISSPPHARKLWDLLLA